MLEVSNLKCVRGERPLFDQVGFRLDRGAVLHLRGANGAGKTSLLRILCGFSPPEAGLITWNGVAVGELGGDWRRDLFYLGHSSALQESLTVAENLAFTSTLAGEPAGLVEIAAALLRFGLKGLHSRLVRQLSQGQKRRVALARLLLSKAPLWILDEPFVALDVAAVNLLSGIIAEHLERGGLAILTSHQPVEIGSFAVQELELV